MNNIYKVIWSKAKNCYVVASEIARSHTKSASGSEKIGGVARHALLALGAACAIACGGFVNVGAAVQRETISPAGTTSNPVLTASNPDDDEQLNKVISEAREDKLVTKDNIAGQLTDYAKASDLSAKADANDVYSKKDAENTFATKTELGSYAKSADVYSQTDADDKFATKDALNGKADQTALNQATDRITANEAAITGLTTKTTDQQTAIDDLKKKTAEISNEAGGGTNISGVKIKDGNILGNGNSAITGLTNVETGSIKTGSINGKSLTGTNVATEKNVADAVKTETDARTEADNKLEGKINQNSQDIATLNGKVATAEGNITDLKKKDTELEGRIQNNEGNIETNKNAISDINKRTGGITRNDAATETKIEGHVTVDNVGNVTADGKLNVTGASDLKGDVTLGTTNGMNTVTVNGNADFHEAVNMDKGLTVNGATQLENTTVDGNLKVTGTITTDKMVFGDKATNNYTEIDQGKITSKNDVLAGDATKKKSSMELDHSKLEVGVTDKDSNGHLTMTADQTSIKNSDLDGKNYSEIVADKDRVTTTVKDEKGNTTSTKSSATEIRNYASDAAGNKTNNVQTATQNKSWAKDKDGNESSIVQTGKDITNTAKDGTITNDANHIVNKANTMDTTVTGKATESYGELETTVNGKETHTVTGNQDIHVTGKQTNTVGGGQINNITGGQTNNILTGDQKTTVSDGSIINKAENGNISNTAQNVTNEGTESVTNKVGKNEVKVSKDGVNIKAEDGKKITESVGTAFRVVENDKITDEAGNSTVTTENGKGTTFGKEGIADTTNIYGDSIKTGTINARDTTTGKLTAGAAADVDGGRLTVDADGVKGSYKYGDYTSRSYILANTLQSGVDNGKDITDNGFVGSRTDHYMDGDKAKLNETVKDADGSNVTKKTSTKTYTEIKDTNGNTLSVNQKADGNNYKLEDQDGNTNHVTNSATQSKQTLKDKDGNTLTTNQTATKNNFDLKSADGSKENHTTNTVDESRVAIKGENGKAELSTTDEGTTFKHSAAKEAFTEGGATNTTIKGNTITTGKVTMDYADVMKDLGVYGNTTLGEAGKDTTLTVNSKATFNEIATFENGAEVKNGLTVSSGGLNVTGESTFNDKVNMKNGLDVTGGVASDSFTVKGTDIKIDSSGINAGGTVISNVADGSISEGSKDAVNGGQLYQVKNDLEGKVNKVGANAAAMANLHPMEFDPDSKWNIAAAIGNYGSETAAALGAFYRPNDDVMVNLSTAFGTGENMVGGGVSVRLGKGGNKLSREESNALKDQVNDLTARMDALLSVLNPNMSKDFPDVPENHWAYEAVSRLAGNDIVQGYPDGEFHGERTMTRYEMAEIIYNALSRGAEAEKELVEEFKPELQAMAASEKPQQKEQKAKASGNRYRRSSEITGSG